MSVPSGSVHHFVQECPTCGRALEILNEYAGQEVVCGHCGRRFNAGEEISEQMPDALQQRIERLLNAPAGQTVRWG